MNKKLLTLALLSATLVIPLITHASDDDDRKDHRRHAEFGARLTGAQEVPPAETETSGRFRIEFNRKMTSAEYRLRVNDGIRVTQAHIHCAPEGSNGPVVIFLAGFHASGWDVDGWWVGNAGVTDANIVNTTCGASLADIAESMDNGMTYVNVHTVAIPSGEVRGQIKRRD